MQSRRDEVGLPAPSPTAGPWRHTAHRTAEIRPYPPPESDAATPTPRGPLAAVQRAVRRALRWYLWPATAQMSAHNHAIAGVLAEHRRQLTLLGLDAERLDVDTVSPATTPDARQSSRVAIVVHRFGAGITGGAEAHARQVGAHLAERGHEITVLTTCAEDYVTWANVLPPGEDRDGALRVLRFPVRAERDLNRWGAAMQPILAGEWGDAEEEAMLREQGPDSPALLDHLREHGTEYDAVMFYTLLYHPTVYGLPLVHERSILVPTLHDELTVRLNAQARAIRLARRVMWLTPEERELAERLYDVADLPGAVAGTGVDAPATLHVEQTRARFGLERPYLLYAGRIDTEKGCGEMIDDFLAWARTDGRADLVLAGRAWMDIPDHPRIHHVGFVDSAALTDLMAGATATVVPSRFESLSMLALESLACGTPILVTAASPVLQGHARRSRAGLVYRSAAEFAAAASRLLDQPDARAQLGSNGRTYIDDNFTWECATAQYEAAIAAVRRSATGAART